MHASYQSVLETEIGVQQLRRGQQLMHQFFGKGNIHQRNGMQNKLML